MRRIFVLAAIATAFAAHAKSPGNPRFSGDAALRTAAPASADGRFAMSAQLRPADAPTATGRFTLAAKLDPEKHDKSIATACSAAGVTIFSNGFEN